MSCVTKDIAVDTIREIIISGLNAMHVIPDGMNVLDLNFSDLNRKKGTIPVEFKMQKYKEVTVLTH